MASGIDTTSGRVARALRSCAAIWLAMGALSIALSIVSDRIVESIQDGRSYEEVSSSLLIVSLSSTAVHVLGTVAIAIWAGTWAAASAIPRDRMLVQLGRVALGLSLVLHLAQVTAWQGDVTSEEFETLQRVRIAGWLTWYLGAALLVGGTRGPAAIRIGYGVLATAWVTFLVWINATDEPPELPRAPMMLAGAVLTMTATAGLWLAAPHYSDVGPAPRSSTSDPMRHRAADGIALLRGALLGRIALAVASVVVLIALRSSPGAAGSVAWLLALAQCGIAVTLWIALTRYSSLPDDALERASITLVIVCAAVGALLELYGAVLSSELFGYLAQAERATSLWDMPSISEFEKLQAKAQWVARLSSVIGLVAAVALAHSLRRTALWLENLENARRASTLIGLTILGGGTTVVLMAVVQSGTLEGLGPLAVVMLVAAGVGLAILVGWLRLFAEVIALLRGDPPGVGPSA